MGEAKRRQLAVQTQALEAMVVDTPGGRIHVKWDHGASATPNAQLTFFSEFLATTGRAQPLRPYHRAARRRGEPADSGDEESHQRRRAAARTVAHERRAKPGLACPPAHG